MDWKESKEGHWKVLEEGKGRGKCNRNHKNEKGTMESFYCLIVIPRLIVFLYSCVHIQPATDQLVLQYILPFPESYTHRGGRQEISLSGWVPVPKQIPLLQHLMFCHCQLSWDGLLSSSCLTTSAWTTIQDYLSKYCPKLVLLSLERGGEGLIPVFVYMYPHYTGLQSGRNTYSWFEHLRAPQVSKCCFWQMTVSCHPQLWATTLPKTTRHISELYRFSISITLLLKLQTGFI